MYKSTNYSLSFKAEELAEKLIIASQNLSSGYWHYQYKKSPTNQSLQNWFLGVSQGKIVYSGVEKLSWKIFLKITIRYTPGLRATTKKALLSIERQFNPTQPFCLTQMLNAIEKTSIITKQQAIEALYLKILSDFDTYLFTTSGSIQFSPHSPLVHPDSSLGFDLQQLIEQARQRRILWQKLKTQIPSLDSKPIINSDRISKSKLTPVQKQRLHALIKKGKSLQGIAITLGKDTLEIAKFFVPFIRHGLITIVKSSRSQESNGPKILIVDDSPILTKQFQSLVTKWGYQLKSCHDPHCAVDIMTNYRPAIIFIDINMPGLSGFDLVKLIRKKSQIASIPMVILTSENKLSNKWRANWSNCKFLIKPISMDRINVFPNELQEILQELAPISTTVAVA